MLPQKEPTETSFSATSPTLTAEEILARLHPPCRGLFPVIRFVFHSEGKRLRPRLLLLAARMFGVTPPHLAEAATLVEALHNGTLLHDDVMDRARVRRNRPTVNRLWGDGVAILAGDYLLASVMDLALRTHDPAILPIAVETLIKLVEGQMMELQNQGNLRLTEQTSIAIIERKTASLFSMACKLGGLLGGGRPDQIVSLETFGLHLGVAFQLFDDLQDYLSDRFETGKEPGRDLAEGKVTLPALVAFRQAGTRDKKRMRQIFSDPQRAKCLREFSALVEDYGGFSYTLRQAQARLETAVSSLHTFQVSEERTCLEQAAWDVLRQNTPRTQKGGEPSRLGEKRCL